MQRCAVDSDVLTAHLRGIPQANPGIGLGDYLVAATATTEGLQLVTLNVRHFPMFAELQAPFDLPNKQSR